MTDLKKTTDRTQAISLQVDPFQQKLINILGLRFFLQYSTSTAIFTFILRCSAFIRAIAYDVFTLTFTATMRYGFCYYLFLAKIYLYHVYFAITTSCILRRNLFFYNLICFINICNKISQYGAHFIIVLVCPLAYFRVQYFDFWVDWASFTLAIFKEEDAKVRHGNTLIDLNEISGQSDPLRAKWALYLLQKASRNSAYLKQHLLSWFFDAETLSKLKKEMDFRVFQLLYPAAFCIFAA